MGSYSLACNLCIKPKNFWNFTYFWKDEPGIQKVVEELHIAQLISSLIPTPKDPLENSLLPIL